MIGLYIADMILNFESIKRCASNHNLRIMQLAVIGLAESSACSLTITNLVGARQPCDEFPHLYSMRAMQPHVCLKELQSLNAVMYGGPASLQ